MALTVQDALTRINEMEAKCASLSYAVAVLANDGNTVAPKRSVTMRGESLASLTEQLYHLTVNPEVEEALELLREHTAELDDRTARRVELLLEDLDRQKKIPVEDMMEFTRLRSEGHISWVEAKDNNDFDAFAPVLQKLVDMSCRIAGYTDPDKHPYDAMLDRYEKGMTRDYCDSYFGALREKLVPLVAAVAAQFSGVSRGLSPVFSCRRAGCCKKSGLVFEESGLVLCFKFLRIWYTTRHSLRAAASRRGMQTTKERKKG